MTTEVVRIGILGRTDIEVAGQETRPLSVRQREMLAVLAMSPGEPVPVATIARALWDERSAANSRAGVHTVAHRLRRAVGAELIITEPPDGYTLRVPPESVDLYRFRALGRAARAALEPSEELGAWRQALALWRGEPFEDLPSDWLHREVAPGIREERFGALDRRLQLELDAGRHAEILSELHDLVARYPLRETLWARLMIALCRSGRQAESFAAYRRISASLRDEYGADPGEELIAAHQEMLHGGTVSVLDSETRPAAGGRSTLPRDLETFTDRPAHMADLLAAADTAEGGRSVVCVLEGMAGAGKTTLAVHTARQLTERFPDGQFYVDLHAHTAGRDSLSAGAALTHLLATLGVDRRRVPVDLDGAAALWRAMLADRRVLLVLDDAANSAQVRPLLPGEGGCLTIVTSRRSLSGLDGVRAVPVGPAEPTEAAQLFVRVAGRAELAVDDAAVTDVVEMCGRLPLALAIAAARLQHHPTWTVANLAATLRGERRRMEELHAEDRDVATVLGLSIRQLPTERRDLLALLCLYIPGSTDRYSAAALAGTTSQAVEAVLEDLTETHLLGEPVAGRYEPHDLLRLYGRERLAPDIPPERRAAAARRLLDHYLAVLLSVDRVVRPHAREMRTPFEGTEAAAEPAFADAAGALAWCSAEHTNLLGSLELAAALGDLDTVWRLAWLLWTYLDRSGRITDIVTVQRTGLVAARAVGQQLAEARMLNALGFAYQDLGRFDEALEHLRESAEVAERHGLTGSWLSALNNIGVTYGRRGDYKQAIGVLEQVVARADNPQRLSDALGNIGEAHRYLGDLVAARHFGEQAWRVLADAGDEYGVARKRLQLVETCRLLGDLDAATEHARAVLPVVRANRDQIRVAESLTYLGHVYHQRGDHARAHREWSAALDILVPLNLPEAEEVRKLLAAGRPPAAGT
jgi:DNA-binding SARP family transcriptional activator/tetratricopeptide (TPR) repeat protein